MLKAYILHRGEPTSACLIAYANSNQEAATLNRLMPEADRAPFLDDLAKTNGPAHIETNPCVIQHASWSYRGRVCQAQGGGHANR